MKKITKRQIVRRVTNKLEKYTQYEVQEILQALIDEIGDSLANGDAVAMRTFGSFTLRVNKQKVGRNPKKKDSEVIIPARAVVKFTPGEKLKDRVAQVLPKLIEE